MLENLLISLFNSWRDRSTTPAPQPEVKAEPPPGQLLLGHTLPSAAKEGQPAPERESVFLSPQARLRHLLLCGGTGSGKTNTLLQVLESDIRHGRSFVCLDLVGDLIDRVLLRLAHQKKPEDLRGKLFLLDLRERGWVPPFNPLAGQDEPYTRVLNLVEVIRGQSESWGVQLAETLHCALSALAQGGYSLLEVEPFLTNAAFRAHVLRSCTDAYARSFARRYEALGNERQKALWQPVLNKLAPFLAVPDLQLLFGQQGSFSFSGFDRVLREGETAPIVLVALDAPRLGSASRLVGGMFVSALQGYMTTRGSRPERERAFLHLALDEFAQFTFASDRFQSLVAEGRRYGVSLSLAHQNAAQLDTGMRHLIRNNFAHQLFFATGALDAGELAREIVLEDEKVDARELLLTQKVGEAILVRRGQKAVRLRVPPCPDPSVASEAVEAIRRVAHESFARPRREVERELRERAVFIESLRLSPRATAATASARPSRNSTGKGSPGIAPSAEAFAAVETSASVPAIVPATLPEPVDNGDLTYEIRHEKPEYFRAAPKPLPQDRLQPPTSSASRTPSEPKAKSHPKAEAEHEDNPPPSSAAE